MKKNGFTITEIVTTLALFSIVAVILIPKINQSIKESRADQLEEIRENIMKATEVYLDNSCGKDSYDKLINNNSIRIYLDNIRDCGLIQDKIYNPVSGTYFEIQNEYVDVFIDEVGMKDYKMSF